MLAPRRRRDRAALPWPYPWRPHPTADPGNEEMVRLMSVIRQGAMAFLRREYLAIAVFVALMTILIVVFLPWGWPWGAAAYVFGAFLSALAGFIGMRIATAANARTAEAARQGGVALALPVAFRGGAVMGFTVAGLGLLGFSLGIWFFRNVLDRDDWVTIVTAIAVEVVVVSAAVEAHADAMIAIAAKPTAVARWLGKGVTAADLKRVSSSLACARFQLPVRSLRSLPVRNT